MTARISDIAFTPAVKARQSAFGSRTLNEDRPDWHDRITDDLAAFLATRDSFYMATVSSDGHPYIQHRGGPPGFLQVLDERTLGFADLTGNRQYISLGNLDGNDRVHLFVMDYAHSQRIKIWGRARIVEEDDALLERLTNHRQRARPERGFVIAIDAWDANCPQHIPALHSEATIRAVTARLMERISALEAENADLKRWLDKT